MTLQEEELGEVRSNRGKRVRKKVRTKSSADAGRARVKSDLFNWDLSDDGEFEGFTEVDLKKDEAYRENYEVEEVIVRSRTNTTLSLFPENSSDEDFLGFTVQSV